jgi:hypothetical protein
MTEAVAVVVAMTYANANAYAVPEADAEHT